MTIIIICIWDLWFSTFRFHNRLNRLKMESNYSNGKRNITNNALKWLCISISSKCISIKRFRLVQLRSCKPKWFGDCPSWNRCCQRGWSSSANYSIRPRESNFTNTDKCKLALPSFWRRNDILVARWRSVVNFGRQTLSGWQWQHSLHQK